MTAAVTSSARGKLMTFPKISVQAQLMESFKSTWSTISEFAKSHLTSSAIEGAVDKVVEEVSAGGGGSGQGRGGGVGSGTFVTSEISSTQTEEDVDMGAINGGRRVDYVLQVPSGLAKNTIL